MIRRTEGAIVPFAAILTVAAGILIIFILRILTVKNNESSYVSNMNRCYQVAETGANHALGRIAVEPSNMTNLLWHVPDSPPYEGLYECKFYRRDIPVSGGYYIVTTATRTAGGHVYHTQLHTYALVSNVGDYFAAINDTVGISDHVDAANGKVYGPKLRFGSDIDLKSATFVAPESNCTPLRSAIDTSSIRIAEPTSGAFPHLPTMISTPLLFPQVLPADLVRYQDLAHVTDPDPMKRHIKCSFSGDIYPPGYTEAMYGDDTYDSAKHTSNNADHVFYCPAASGDMHVQGTVHGQVLFVAEKDIYIDGDLVSAPSTDPLPGDPNPLMSTAHQAVLITPKNIKINNTFFTGPITGEQVETIQALMMAPVGVLSCVPYSDPTTHDHLGLHFSGSLIFGSVAGDSTSIPSVFNYHPTATTTDRHYAYMNTLQTNPPPYIPALTEIKYSFEENRGVE